MCSASCCMSSVLTARTSHRFHGGGRGSTGRGRARVRRRPRPGSTGSPPDSGPQAAAPRAARSRARPSRHPGAPRWGLGRPAPGGHAVPGAGVPPAGPARLRAAEGGTAAAPQGPARAEREVAGPLPPQSWRRAELRGRWGPRSKGGAPATLLTHFFRILGMDSGKNITFPIKVSFSLNKRQLNVK